MSLKKFKTMDGNRGSRLYLLRVHGSGDDLPHHALQPHGQTTWMSGRRLA